MDKFDKLAEIITLITNKKVLRGSLSFRQDLNNIYAHGWMELIHEFCHFVVATKEERLHYNLGYVDGEKESKHLIEQEIRASELTALLCDCITNKNKKETDYLDYVRNADERLEYSALYNKKDLDYIIIKTSDFMKTEEVLKFIANLNFM